MELLNKKPNVLCILDEFSFNCFKPECEKLIPLNQKKWKQQVNECTFDFFLCESVWKPIGSQFIMGSCSKKERRALFFELKSITSYFKSLNIPTVFWNKEDNKHYNLFKAFASLFDHIFTTDIRTIKSYKRECPSVKTIDTLVFAAQPLLHNPINNTNKYEGDVFFAGGWYTFPERMMELEELLQLPNNIKLHIYERGLTRNKKSKFPTRYRSRLKYGINYVEMSQKYKSYPIMLNVNSVKGSTTMFSRRVPEALLCGVSVISSPSISIKLLFPHVFLKKTKEEVFMQINKLLKNSEDRYEYNHKARRHILLNHIYFNRMEQICKTINIIPPKFKMGVVNLYIPSNNVICNNILIDDIKKQTYENVVCTIEVMNNPLIINVLKNLFNYRKLPDGKINESIGFICLFHSKSRYEKDYILDSILSYKYFNNIDIIGKACINYWENNKIGILNPELENCLASNIHPHTITISLAGDINMREKKLNYLLNIIENKNTNSENLKIYSSDKYNFIYVK